MAWSYRQGREDEVYSATGGPALVEELVYGDPQRANYDEDVKEFEKLKKDGKPLPVDGSGNVVFPDPEAGKPVLTPAQRAAQESEGVKQATNLEAQRMAGVEKARIADEERAKILAEESGKDDEKVRKEAHDAAKKSLDEEKKATDEAEKKRQEAAKKETKHQTAQPVHVGR